MTLQEFANQFSNFISVNGGGGSNWYVGIASNVNERLFGDHKVIENTDIYYFANAGTDSNAREVERFLIDNYNTSGAPGGGDTKTIWVYVYKIKSHTIE